MMSVVTSAVIDQALSLAELDYRVFPCWPGTKKPITKNGLHDATTDAATIEQWWEQHPNANLALNTEGMFVLDIDTIDGADNPWEAERRVELFDAPTSRTPGGGSHSLFQQPSGADFRNSESKIANRIDTRANGGYIVVPPSFTTSPPEKSTGSYKWVNEIDVSLRGLPKPPDWLLEQLSSKPKTTTTTAAEITDSSTIPEGKRNGTLAKVAGKLRRTGLSIAEIEAALHVANKSRCKPPLEDSEVVKIAKSIGTREAADDQFKARQPIRRLFAKELAVEFPQLRPPVINGILRRGETMNVVADPKIGKSWLTLGLALSICAGRVWMNRGVKQGKVLLIDNELHAEVTNSRILSVAKALGIDESEYADQLEIANLRGNMRDIDQLSELFETIERGEFVLIVIDAIYRAIPDRMEENRNETWKHINNLIDRYAGQLDSAFVQIHHATKGNQSDKKVTDVGAGGGAQSRAADTHLVIREHEEPKAYVVDAAVRSFPPIEPFVMRWNFPVWTPDLELDPERLKQPTRRTRNRQPKPEHPKEREWNLDRFVAEVLTEEPQNKSEIEGKAVCMGLKLRPAQRFLEQAIGAERAHEWFHGYHAKRQYATVKKPELIPSQGETTDDD